MNDKKAQLGIKPSGALGMIVVASILIALAVAWFFGGKSFTLQYLQYGLAGGATTLGGLLITMILGSKKIFGINLKKG